MSQKARVIAVASGAVGLLVWMVTMASAERYSYGANQDNGNNAFWWILIVVALVGGFVLPKYAGAIGFGLGLPPLVLSPWTSPRGDGDGLWILIIPMLVVFVFVLTASSGAGAWLRTRLARNAEMPITRS